MTNKFVVIRNSLKVPKIKKILLYKMKFLVPNYSCLQNPWLGSYRPQIPVLSLSSVLNWIYWTPPSWTKFLGTPLDHRVVVCVQNGIHSELSNIQSLLICFGYIWSFLTLLEFIPFTSETKLFIVYSMKLPVPQRIVWLENTELEGMQ